MKCPKCDYLGLDTGPRCRHCGYEFSLVDLSSHIEGLSSAETGLKTGPRARRTPGSIHTGHERHTPTPGAGLERHLTRVPDSGPLDLPLFPDDEAGSPHVPAPRPPLGVRRSTPAPVRHRPRGLPPGDGAYELGLEVPPAAPPPPVEADAPVHTPANDPEPQPEVTASSALPWRRLAAAATDVALLGAIDATVLYFTLRVTELRLAQVSALPPVPLVAFFAILNGGYLVLFTGVFGQTLGKMLAGIEVVSKDMAPMDLGRALYRSVVSLLSVLTAGLGFVPALVGEGRALHDHLAGTRVIASRSSHPRS